MVEHLPIGPEMTASELHDQLKRLGADLMVRALAALARGALIFKPQAEAGVTYAAKLTNAETRIDWTLPAQSVHDHVRGLSPFPGAFLEADWGQGRQRIKVLRTLVSEGSSTPGTVLDDKLTIACGGGAVRLLEVQRAGKSPVKAADFLNGTRVVPGSQLV